MNESDYKTFMIFDRFMNVIDKVCNRFEQAYNKPLGEQSRIELYIFSLYYSWRYIQDNDLVEMTAKNASIFTFLSYKRIAKINSNIQQPEFDQLYKDRYRHYKEEFPNFMKCAANNKPYLPYYFYKHIDEDVVNNAEVIDFFDSMDLINKYIDHINNLKTQLDMTN